jgi:hypothetical protein
MFIGAVPSGWAQKVKVDYDHDANFTRIKRYAWRTHPIFEKRPDLQEQYATGIQLVLQAGNEQLRKRGLHPSDASPDVFVTFFISATEKQKERTVIDGSPWWTSGYGWYGSPVWTVTETEYYTDGMLVIDMVDASTSKLLWRAYCSDTIKDFRERHNNINSAVKKAFENFPPKTK